jgi:hypothetical protein
MPQTERLASRRLNGSIQTLLNLPEGRLVFPTWHDTTSTVCRIDEYPATAMKHDTGMGQVNLVAFDGQQASLPEQDIGPYGTVNRLVPMVRGDEQCVVVLEAIKKAAKLVIDFLMHREHRLGGSAVWPISQGITQHLMRDFINGRLVEQHEIGRMVHQGLHGNFPKEAGHAAGQSLEGGHSEVGTFPYAATTKKPANAGPEERAYIMGPGLVGIGGELMYRRTP